MGDRCYMEITCRKCDAHLFEGIGFVIESESGDACNMVDDQADYGHSRDCPENVPFFGWHDAGDAYCGFSLACDGEARVEVASYEDGYLIGWNTYANKPDSRDVEQIREFIALKAKVKQMLGVADTTPNPKPKTTP